MVSRIFSPKEVNKFNKTDSENQWFEM